MRLLPRKRWAVALRRLNPTTDEWEIYQVFDPRFRTRREAEWQAAMAPVLIPSVDHIALKVS